MQPLFRSLENLNWPVEAKQRVKVVRKKTHSTLISSVSASETITASTGLLPQPLTLSWGQKAGKKDGTFLQSHEVNFLTGTFRLHVRYKNYTVYLKYLRACVYIVPFYILIFLFVILIHKRMFLLNPPRREKGCPQKKK